MTDLPFELGFRREAWRARWQEEQLFVTVTGTPDAPSAAHLATLGELVRRWTDVKRSISEFVASLETDVHVPLRPESRGGFAAHSCGFDEELCYDSISVNDDSPERARVTFYTGFPDGYASYEVVLAGFMPAEISAFAS